MLNILCKEIQQRFDAFRCGSVQRSFEEALAPSVAKLMDRLAGKGGYSLVAMFGDGSIIAFRDPHGFRPLFLATDPLDGPICVIASETCAFDAIGRYKTIRPIAAGELVCVSPNREIQTAALQRRKGAFCALEAVYLADVESQLGDVDTYRLRQGLGEALAQQFRGLRERIDLVVGVPESALPAALRVAEVWNRPFGCLLSRSPIRTFMEPDQTRREVAAESKYRLVRSSVQGKRVALVDDSLVRGTTMRTLIRKLREAGAQEVHIMLTFPPVLNPCFYGIDIPDRTQLIAAEAEGIVEGISKILTANSVNFLDKEVIRRVLAPLGPTCFACADGQYPDRPIGLSSASTLPIITAVDPAHQNPIC
jgi:amidophosphoribosyltransferase